MSLRPSTNPSARRRSYDLEQAVQDDVTEELLTAAFAGSLTLDDLLRDYFLRDLHARLYSDIWTWAGRWRQRDVNIGVAPIQIAVELRTALDNIRYEWEHTNDWTPHELGITTHAETVRIHPYGPITTGVRAGHRDG
jgi:fido (protein-threonine AMPylation protein)